MRITEKTLQIIIIIFTISFSAIVVGGVFFYLAELRAGNAEFPTILSAQLVNFLGVILSAFGSFIAFQLTKRRIEESNQNSTNNFRHLDNRLQNGLGEKLAEKVAEKIPEKLDAKPGGHRKYDPPTKEYDESEV